MAPNLHLLSELGFSGGVNRDVAPHAIAENEAYYIQDGLLNRPGMLRRRGPIQVAAGSGYMAAGSRVDGLGAVVDPSGVTKYCVLMNDGTNVKLLLTNFDLSSTNTRNLVSSGITSSTPPYILDAKPAQGGGVLIGVGQQYATTGVSATNRFMLYWRGATKPDYSTGTIAVNAGSRLITGAGTAWLANAEPGMFLLMGGRPVGVVKTVNFDDSFILESAVASPSLNTQPYSLVSARNLLTVCYTAGRITTSTTSAIVSGGNTKFLDQGVSTPPSGHTLDLYAWRGVDSIWIGTINTGATVTNTQITLNANAAAAVTNAKYFIVPVGSAPAPLGAPYGILNSYWNGMQFIGNHDKVIFDGNAGDVIFVTDPFVIDGVDITKDGSYLRLPATQSGRHITSMVPTEAGLLVSRENETHLITGNSPSTLRATRVSADGCYSGAAMIPYASGAIWPGRKSIYRFNGAQVVDILENKARAYYQTNLAQQDLETYRWYAMEQNDHYILHSEYAANIPKALSAVGKHQVWTINLKTGALTFLTNLALRGAVKVPRYGTVYLGAANNPFGSGTQGFLAFGNDLFLDNISVTEAGGLGWGSEISPNSEFLVQTKLYDAGNPETLKRWKQFQMWSNTPTPATLYVYTGLNKAFIKSGSFPGSYGDWHNKLMRFTGVDTHISFVLGLLTPTAQGTAQFGPMAIIFKPERIGRIKAS